MMKKRSVYDYERYVYALKEVTAMTYFIATSDEIDDGYVKDAIAGIYAQLEEIKDGVDELHDVAAELQREVRKLKECNQ